MQLFATKDFDRYLHAVLVDAGHEAQQDGSATIEAQHLLLALAAQDGTEPQRILTAAGLDQPAVRAALEHEFIQSLALAGVTTTPADLPKPSPRRGRFPGLGASAKLAIDRMAGATAKNELRPAHLLAAVLAAEVGTVPRALTAAGVDRTALLTRVRSALDEPK
ncbi:Clp protease [Nocardia sp. 2]|uniref:Clp protease n=1 Tax=Nocardia acididurans TaxID=2802282 RepID=A0ABS1M0P0_9NOCA|nr:Clp protease N-terminal domain-containing protein [Nocardia acididurans]MBL1073896.1 Clp protease [Nocardia acididurans]